MRSSQQDVSSCAAVAFTSLAFGLVAFGCGKTPGGTSSHRDGSPADMHVDSPVGSADAASDASPLDAAVDAPRPADGSPGDALDASPDAASLDAGTDGPPCAPLAWEVLPAGCIAYPDAVACAPYASWAPGVGPYVFREQDCFEASFGTSCPGFLDDPATEIDFTIYDVVEACVTGDEGAYCSSEIYITDVRVCPDLFPAGVIVVDMTFTVPCKSCDGDPTQCLFVRIPNTDAAPADPNYSADDCGFCCPLP